MNKNALPAAPGGHFSEYYVRLVVDFDVDVAEKDRDGADGFDGLLPFLGGELGYRPLEVTYEPPLARVKALEAGDRRLDVYCPTVLGVVFSLRQVCLLYTSPSPRDA